MYLMHGVRKELPERGFMINSSFGDPDRSGFGEVAILQINFNRIESMTFPGMNDGTGTMTARMYNDDL